MKTERAHQLAGTHGKRLEVDEYTNTFKSSKEARMTNLKYERNRNSRTWDITGLENSL